MTQLEKDIEQKLRKMVEKRGGHCLKLVCPGWSGVPDRIVLLPGAHVVFVETKRPKGGRVSKLQKWWHNRLRSFGFVVCLAWNYEDIQAIEWAIETMLREAET